jgi:hypothetical protein
MTEHPRPHDSSMWGPHMHACRLYHRLRLPQSTSTISSDHRTPEHRLPHARTISPITIATVACTHALPPQHASATTSTRARGLVSLTTWERLIRDVPAQRTETHRLHVSIIVSRNTKSAETRDRARLRLVYMGDAQCQSVSPIWFLTGAPMPLIWDAH